jgi:hypothetical protein
MPFFQWQARFLVSYWISLLHLFYRRAWFFVKQPPAKNHRFDVFGGTSVYDKLMISQDEALSHLALEKRVGTNSRLDHRRHAILLDWDGVPREQLESWMRRQGGRWHYYRTERGFHFICSTRTVRYWELVRIIQRGRFQPRGGLNVVLIYGHGTLRVSRKEFGGPDIFKAGIFGQGEELPELVDFIAERDQLLEKFHGPSHPA